MKFKLEKILQIGLAVSIACLGFISVLPTVQAATFEFDPPLEMFDFTCTGTVFLYADATGESSNAADIEISYDPSLVVVTDQNIVTPDTQVQEGIAYLDYDGNITDATTGIMLLTGSNYSNNAVSLTSRQLFATLDLTFISPNPGVVEFTIRYDGLGNTLDSNIASTVDGSDLLTGVVNGRYTFTSSGCDTATPDDPFRRGAQRPEFLVETSTGVVTPVPTQDLDKCIECPNCEGCVVDTTTDVLEGDETDDETEAGQIGAIPGFPSSRGDGFVDFIQTADDFFETPTPNEIFQLGLLQIRRVGMDWLAWSLCLTLWLVLIFVGVRIGYAVVEKRIEKAKAATKKKKTKAKSQSKPRIKSKAKPKPKASTKK